MKDSSETSAKAATESRPTTDRSSARPTPTSADSFALLGPSDLPDPAFHAYRRDLADRALAGRVIASHYAVPVERVVAVDLSLREGPSVDSGDIQALASGDPFWMLDDSFGWAWGYAGQNRRVGYVPADALATP